MKEKRSITIKNGAKQNVLHGGNETQVAFTAGFFKQNQNYVMYDCRYGMRIYSMQRHKRERRICNGISAFFLTLCVCNY